MQPQTTYYFMRAGVSYFYSMWLTITLLYQNAVITQDPLRLVLLGVALEATIFLFEIPTGVIADSYSRKWSVVIGLMMTGSNNPAATGKLPPHETPIQQTIVEMSPQTNSGRDTN